MRTKSDAVEAASIHELVASDPRESPQPAEVIGPPRSWTEVGTGQTFEAALVEAWCGVAYLRRDGGPVAIPLVELSDADRTHVAEAFSVQVLEGRVVGVSSGDEFTLEDHLGETHYVLLDGIDAPESEQPFHPQATTALVSKIFRHPLVAEWRRRDGRGRILGHVSVEGQPLAQWMVAGGWAWSDPTRGELIVLAAAEATARGAKRGLWADRAPVAPWDYRSAVLRVSVDR